MLPLKPGLPPNSAPVDRHGPAADGAPMEVHRDQRLGTPRPEIGVRTALHDPEQRLVGSGVSVLAAAGPGDGPIDRPGNLVAPGRQRPCLDRAGRRIDAELGGLRHSDTVVVTDDGIEILTDYPRDLESLTIPV